MDNSEFNITYVCQIYSIYGTINCVGTNILRDNRVYSDVLKMHGDY